MAAPGGPPAGGPPPPPAAAAPTPRTRTDEEILLAQLLEPTLGQRQAADPAVPGVARGGERANILLFSEPWELALVRDRNINPATFTAILQFWLSGGQKRMANVIQEAQALLDRGGPGLGQDARAAWLMTEAPMRILDVHIVADVLAYLQSRVRPENLPLELSEALQYDVSGDALARALEKHVLVQQGRMDDLQRQDYEGAVYVRAQASLPNRVQALTEENLQLATGARGGTHTIPVFRAAPSQLVAAAAKALVTAGLTAPLSFSYEVCLLSSPKLASESDAVAADKDSPPRHTLGRPRTKAGKDRALLLRRAMHLQQKLASVNAELGNENRLGASAGPGIVGGLTPSDWMADIRRQRLADAFGSSDIFRIGETPGLDMGRLVEELGGSTTLAVAQLFQAHDLAYRDALAWPSDKLAELGTLRMRHIRGVVDAWAEERMREAEDALVHSAMLYVPDEDQFLRSRQALLARLWISLVEPSVNSLLSSLANGFNLLKMPLSGSERAHFTRRWLDLAFDQHKRESLGMAEAVEVRRYDEIGMLRQISLALHTEDSLRDTAQEWSQLRHALNPGDTPDEIRDFLDKRVLLRDTLGALPTDHERTGVVLGWRRQLEGALRDGLDAMLLGRYMEERRKREASATDSPRDQLKRLYAALYQSEVAQVMSEIYKAGGSAVPADIPRLLADATKEAYLSLGELVAFPVTGHELADLRSGSAPAKTIRDALQLGDPIQAIVTAATNYVASLGTGAPAVPGTGDQLTKAALNVDVVMHGRLVHLLSRHPPEFLPPGLRDLPGPEAAEKANEAVQELLNMLSQFRYPQVARSGGAGVGSLPEQPILGDVRLHRRELLEYEARRLLWQLTHDPSEPEDEGDSDPSRILSIDHDWAQGTPEAGLGAGLRDGDVRVQVRIPLVEPGVHAVTATLVRRNPETGTYAPLPTDLASGTSVTEEGLSPADWGRDLVIHLIPPSRSLLSLGSSEYSVRLQLKYRSIMDPGHATPVPRAVDVTMPHPSKGRSRVQILFTEACVRCRKRYVRHRHGHTFEGEPEQPGANSWSACSWWESPGAVQAEVQAAYDESLQGSLVEFMSLGNAEDVVRRHASAFDGVNFLESEWAALRAMPAVGPLLPEDRQDMTVDNPNLLRIYLEAMDYGQALRTMLHTWRLDRLEYTDEDVSRRLARLPLAVRESGPRISKYEPWFDKSNAVFVRVLGTLLRKYETRVLPRLSAQQRKSKEPWSYYRLVQEGYLRDGDDDPELSSESTHKQRQKTDALREFDSIHYVGAHSPSRRSPDLLEAVVSQTAWNDLEPRERARYEHVREALGPAHDGQTNIAFGVRMPTRPTGAGGEQAALLWKEAQVLRDQIESAIRDTHAATVSVKLYELDQLLRRYNRLLTVPARKQ